MGYGWLSSQVDSWLRLFIFFLLEIAFFFLGLSPDTYLLLVLILILGLIFELDSFDGLTCRRRTFIPILQPFVFILLNHFSATFEIDGGFPGVIVFGVIFPFDEVLGFAVLACSFGDDLLDLELVAHGD